MDMKRAAVRQSQAMQAVADRLTAIEQQLEVLFEQLASLDAKLDACLASRAPQQQQPKQR